MLQFIAVVTVFVSSFAARDTSFVGILYKLRGYFIQASWVFLSLEINPLGAV